MLRVNLTATVLAAKVTNFVIDSTVMLRYINCTSVRITTFVAN